MSSSATPRSLLYVPAARRDLLAKVPTVAADRVVVDLEDGVAPSAKNQARANLRDAELGAPDQGEVLEEVARGISQQLPAPADRPALVTALPAEGLVPFSDRFFHTHQSFCNGKGPYR